LLAVGFVLGGLFVLSFQASSLSNQLAQMDNDPVVLFNSTSTYSRSIGFYSPESQQGIVCDVSRRDEVQISRSAYKYVDSTECRVVGGDLVEHWDDPEFRNFNVFERGQKLLQNQSNSTSE